MHSKARGAARRDPTTTRAYQEHIQASLDNTCPECRGTLHIWRNHHAEHRGRATLQQH